MCVNVCQSCGMPLAEENLLGTENNGLKSKEYCVYCYENGEFKQSGLTMEGMIEICVPYMNESGMEEGQARAILNDLLPKLKRWSKS
ncbi:MAG: zinc ribbon domain-containing protein [Bacillota bacterium]